MKGLRLGIFLGVWLCALGCGGSQAGEASSLPISSMAGVWEGVVVGRRHSVAPIRVEFSADQPALAHVTVGTSTDPDGKPLRYSTSAEGGLYDVEGLVPLGHLRLVAREPFTGLRPAIDVLVSNDAAIAQVARYTERGRARVMGAAEHKVYLSRQGTGPSWPHIAAVLGELPGTRPVSDGDACTGDIAAWAERGRELQALRQPGAYPGDLLSDEVFEAAFGAPFSSVTAEQLASFAGTLRGRCEAADRLAQRGNNALAALLLSPRDYLMHFAHPLRRSVAAGWANSARERMASDVELSLSQLYHLEALPNRMGLGSVYPETRDLKADIAAFNERSRSRAADRELVERFGSDEAFGVLVGLYDGVAADRPDLMPAIQSQLEERLPVAAETLAESADSLNDALVLNAFALRFADEEACMAGSNRICRRIADRFDDALEPLTERLADELVAKAEPVIDADATLDDLVGQVRFRDRVARRYEPLASRFDDIADALEDIDDERRDLQEDLDDELLAAVETASDGTAMIQVRDRFFASGDLVDSDMSDVRETLQERLADIAPFHFLPGGSYLDALANNDTQTLRALDNEVMAGVKPVMNLAMGSMELLAPLAQALGGTPVTPQSRQRAIDNLSAIDAVLGTYLLRFQDVYASCLKPTAAEFVVTRSSDTVTTEFGREISRVRNWTTEDSYRVNPEDVRYMRELWHLRPQSADVRLFDALLNQDRVQTLLRGLAQAMAAHDCDSPQMSRLVSGMKRYFDNVQARSG